MPRSKLVGQSRFQPRTQKVGRVPSLAFAVRLCFEKQTGVSYGGEADALGQCLSTGGACCLIQLERLSLGSDERRFLGLSWALRRDFEWNAPEARCRW